MNNGAYLGDRKLIVIDANCDLYQAKSGKKNKTYEIISKKDFFSYFFSIIFSKFQNLTIDENYIRIASSSILAENNFHNLDVSRRYVSILDQIHKNKTSAHEILSYVKNCNDFSNKCAYDIILMLAKIEENLFKNGKLTKNLLLNLFLKKENFDFNLNSRFSEIIFFQNLNLSELELAALWKFEKASGTKVDFCLKKNNKKDKFYFFLNSLLYFEIKDTKFVDFLHFNISADIQSEYFWIGKFAYELNSRKKKATLAVALPVVDGNAIILKSVIESFGVKINNSLKITVSESSCVLLLFGFLKLRNEGLSEDLVLSIICNDAYLYNSKSYLEFNFLFCFLRDRLVDYDFKRNKLEEDVNLFFFEIFDFFFNKLNSEINFINLKKYIRAICVALKIASRVPSAASAYDFFSLSAWISRCFAKKAPGDGSDEFSRAICLWRKKYFLKKEITIDFFISLIRNICSSVFVKNNSYFDSSKVEILSLKKLIGRKFDYVIIASMTSENFTKANTEKDLISDLDKKSINRLMKNKIFFKRHCYDFYLSNASCSASKGLIFSCFRKDEKGRLQSRSALFDSCLRASGKSFDFFKKRGFFVNTGNDAINSPYSSADGLGCIFPKKSNTGVAEFKKVDLLANISIQRFYFFLHKQDNEFPYGFFPFSFNFGRSFLLDYFSVNLGFSPRTPVHLSSIESFSRCHFEAFTKKFLKKDLRQSHVFLFTINAFFRKAFWFLYKKTHCNEFKQILRFFCYCDFILMRNKRGSELLMLKSLLLFTKDIIFRFIFLSSSGTEDREADCLFFDKKLEPSPLIINNAIFFTSSILGHVSAGKDFATVADYELFKSNHIKETINEHELLKAYFQIPVYLRIMFYNSQQSRCKNLGARIFNVRNGRSSKTLNKDSVKNFINLVLSDFNDSGITCIIKKPLNSFFSGFLSLHVNDFCEMCKDRSVCGIFNGH